MLLRFAIKNYKSFKDENVFSMEPAPKQKDLSYSILSSNVSRKLYKGLCSSVIYGANASGKTSIIGAIEVLQQIILSGNINNKNLNTPNVAVNKLELVPNSGLAEKEPVVFSIKFIEEGIVFDYQLIADFGRFLDREYNRKIIREQLSINELNIFVRTNDEVVISNLDAIKSLLDNDFILKSEDLNNAAKRNIKATELYLSNNFKSFYSVRLFEVITNWFKTKLTVVVRGDRVCTAPKAELVKNTQGINHLINLAAKNFGANANTIIYAEPIDKGQEYLELGSIIEKEEKKILIPAETYESYGTMRFIELFPLMLGVLTKGGTLVIDEMDASIHPMAIMSLINIFHNDEINKNKAQLIFNTHNPIFLDRNLFRRDEIKFVERDEATYQSIIYALSDFGTCGRSGVRKTGDYMKNYFVSRYGAIRDVDFSDLFKKMIDKYNEGSHVNNVQKTK
ncbi:MAG TPA: ATP-binding protein [Candidatus Avacidaminococcus intestinavium]|uniref:ATP-binding protein n=1 Tax=Candidatus Avacidaminococcus intestinavium TaxID=2840684 RepID=A0A9D1MP41_9FIRM|nr:ATP-binding protein [Candidatus Avacidaminococcus intestinavium]